MSGDGGWRKCICWEWMGGGVLAHAWAVIMAELWRRRPGEISVHDAGQFTHLWPRILLLNPFLWVKCLLERVRPGCIVTNLQIVCFFNLQTDLGSRSLFRDRLQNTNQLISESTEFNHYSWSLSPTLVSESLETWHRTGAGTRGEEWLTTRTEQ